MKAIEVIDLYKTYRGMFRNGIEALKGVSLVVEEGEIFGLLGPNGAGKTTLIKCLLGITFPTKGEAKILGIDSRRVAAREHVGYLPEDHSFPEFLKGERALDYFAKLFAIKKQKRDKKIDELLSLMELVERRRSKIGEYSKGMRQRLGIAQTLLNDPKVIFLDEPTQSLDPLGRKQIKDLMLKLKQDGATVFISSHILSEIEMVCDRVAVLHKGELLKEGSVEELTKEKSLEDVFVELVTAAKTMEQ